MSRIRTRTTYRRNRLLGRLLLHSIMGIIAILFVLPFIIIVSASLSDDATVLLNGYRILPQNFSLQAYRYILSDPHQLLTGYRVTLVVTIIGTSVGLLISSMLGYALSRTEFSLRKPFSIMVFIPILFQGGLVPFYILMTRYLNLRDTLFALILPFLVVPMWVLILRTYFRSLPGELLDAARVDGAGELRIFFQIALPLTIPALVTISLFYVRLYWNDYFLGLLFITRSDLTSLQFMLYRIMANLQFLRDNMQFMGGAGGVSLTEIPLQTIRMALAVLGVTPMALIFLLLQRYYIGGLTIGSLKE